MNFMKKSLLVFCGGLTLLGNNAAAMNFNFDFDKADKTAGELNKVTNNLRNLGQYVSKTVLPQFDQTLDSFNQTLVNTDHTVEKLQPMVLDVTATVNKALDFAANKKKLRLFTKFLNENAGTINDTLVNVDKTVAGVNGTIKEGQTLVKDGDKLLDKGNKFLGKGEKLVDKISGGIDNAVDKGEKLADRLETVAKKVPNLNLSLDSSIGEKFLVVAILFAAAKLGWEVVGFGCDKLKECWV